MSGIIFEKVEVELGSVRILDQVSATVPDGSCTAIVGPNGAGKTTLLKAVLGQIPYRGRISFRGRPRIGYLPQRFMFDRGLPLTVGEFLAMGRQRWPLWLGLSRPVRIQVQQLLDMVEAGGLAERRLGALSGGELQRVMLALALQDRPELLVLDEPEAGVDIAGGALFCGLLDRLRREQGFTQLMVSHDLGMVAAHAGHVIGLHHRVTAEGPPTQVLSGDSLLATFGLHRALVGSGAAEARPCCPDRRCTCQQAGRPHLVELQPEVPRQGRSEHG